MSKLIAFTLLLLNLISSFQSVLGADSKFDVLKEQWCGDDNCYDVLGVIYGCGFREIKYAYNNLSLTLHPDKNPDASDADKDRYVRVNNAYEILSNSVRRTKYDEYLRIKASMDSPVENPIFVLALLYAVATFIVLQYQTQRYQTIRKGILEKDEFQKFFLEKHGIDLSGGELSKTVKRKTKKKGKKSRPHWSPKKKKTEGVAASSSNSNLSGTDSGDEETKEQDTEITDAQINEAVESLEIFVPGWIGEKPDWKFAATLIPTTTVYLAQKVYFMARFQYREFQKLPLTEEDREYVCRKHHKFNAEEWAALKPDIREKYLSGKGAWNRGRKRKQKQAKKEQ